MIIGILIGAMLALLLLWANNMRRRLAALAENIHHAMNQIGIQLSSRFDALAALLELAKGYAARETVPIMEGIQSRRHAIFAASAPDDVLQQVSLISETLAQIAALAEKYPALQADAAYAERLCAAECYEKMIRTSSLIYNDSVAKFNHELQSLPISLLGRLFGFHLKEYLPIAGEESKAPRRS